MVTTPDIAADLVGRMVELLPAHFDDAGDDQNIWVGREREPGGVVLEDAVFVREIAESHNVMAGASQERFHDVRILLRHDEREDAAAKVRVRALYDALHLSGGFTGASGVAYTEIRCVSSPLELEPGYYVQNVTLWRVDR